jgi:hypothetical protein
MGHTAVKEHVLPAYLGFQEACIFIGLIENHAMPLPSEEIVGRGPGNSVIVPGSPPKSGVEHVVSIIDSAEARVFHTPGFLFPLPLEDGMGLACEVNPVITDRITQAGSEFAKSIGFFIANGGKIPVCCSIDHDHPLVLDCYAAVKDGGTLPRMVWNRFQYGLIR